MKRDLIIRRPELQTFGQRVLSTLLTLAFWFLWFYLWLPLITLLAWWYGWEITYFSFVEMEGYKDLIEVLPDYLLTIGTLGLALSSWALYNFLRFRNRERRKTVAIVSNAELAATFGVEEQLLEHVQQARMIRIHYDDKGNITRLLPLRAKQKASCAETGNCPLS